jgi:hypothetical protein
MEFDVGNMSRGFRDVLLELANYPAGHCVPSHETLAGRAKVSVSTVEKALRRAKILALLVWRSRHDWDGWRWLRTSNCYRFLMPETPVEPRSFRPSTRKEDGGKESFSYSTDSDGVDPVDNGDNGDNSLAERAAVWEATLPPQPATAEIKQECSTSPELNDGSREDRAVHPDCAARITRRKAPANRPVARSWTQVWCFGFRRRRQPDR